MWLQLQKKWKCRLGIGATRASGNITIRLIFSGNFCLAIVDPRNTASVFIATDQRSRSNGPLAWTPPSTPPHFSGGSIPP